jgi:4'-phosphopantetheinyl transferase
VIPSDAVVLVARASRALAMLPGEPLGAAAAERCVRLRTPADRADFTAARLLAAAAHRSLTGERIAVAEIVQRCEECGGPHGRPLATAAGARLSWSHAGGVVAAAAAFERIGVDVEPLPADTGVGLLHIAPTALTPEEGRIVERAPDPAAAFLLAWTAKEALTKAGAARLDDFAALRVLADDVGLLPRVAGLELSARSLAGFVVSAAAGGPVRWLAVDDSGATAPLAAGLVGGAA